MTAGCTLVLNPPLYEHTVPLSGERRASWEKYGAYNELDEHVMLLKHNP
jgi:hypothetical protein